MFSQVSVYSQPGEGGTYLGQEDGTYLGWGYLPWTGGGASYPSGRCLSWMGYLPWMEGTYLEQRVPTVDGGGLPTLDEGTYPGMGGTYPGMGEYLPWTQGVPSTRLDEGTPPPPPPQLRDRESEYLLRGRRYASCVHVGGLSCLLFGHNT